MKVLYVNPFAQEVSGPDESLLGLLQSLQGVIEPVVVIPPHGPQAKRYRDAGAEVIEQPMQRIRRTTDPNALLAYGGLFLPETLRFTRLIRRHQIELVHTNMEVVLQSGLAARLSGVPSVYHVRGTSFAHPRHVCDVVVGAINRLSDEIIVISEAVGKIFYERGIREKVSVIYNSLNPSAFDSIDATAVKQLRDELTEGDTTAPLVATVGRINPRKGLECFVRAATLVSRERPDARFAIVGDAADDFERDYLVRLQEMALSGGLQGRLVFAPARRNIAELMGALDLFVMTSLNEGFGRVLIEAMAARLPVVASDIGGIPEIVEDGVTGRLVAADDHAAFATAITGLLADSATLSQFGINGRRRVETIFSHSSQAPAVHAIYERLLGQRQLHPLKARAR